ncbi:MAG: hypothetical protein WAQ98_18810 [Blastocatellia bacterium]
MSNPGEMIRQAIEEMKQLSTAEEMADCFEKWGNQIKQIFPGWNFYRDKTSDNSHIFIGRTLGQVLVIRANCQIYKGSDFNLAAKLLVDPTGFNVDYSKLKRVF